MSMYCSQCDCAAASGRQGVQRVIVSMHVVLVAYDMGASCEQQAARDNGRSRVLRHV
jgi:hypothetical protein